LTGVLAFSGTLTFFFATFFLAAGFLMDFLREGLGLLARGLDPKNLFEDVDDFTEHEWL
jgi:hypothetical protein